MGLEKGKCGDLGLEQGKGGIWGVGDGVREREGRRGGEW